MSYQEPGAFGSGPRFDAKGRCTGCETWKHFPRPAAMSHHPYTLPCSFLWFLPVDNFHVHPSEEYAGGKERRERKLRHSVLDAAILKRNAKPLTSSLTCICGMPFCFYHPLCRGKGISDRTFTGILVCDQLTSHSTKNLYEGRKECTSQKKK